MSEIVKNANEYKLILAERARRNYNKRKQEGRQKMKLIKKEDQQKRGPKPKTEKKQPTPKPKAEPKPRGPKPLLINDVSEIPSYINKLIKQPEHEPEKTNKKIMIYNEDELLKFVKNIWDHPATKNNIWSKYDKNDISEISDIGIWGLTEEIIINIIIKGEEKARIKEIYQHNFINWADKYNTTSGNIGDDGRGCSCLIFKSDKILYKNGKCSLTTLNIDELLFMDALQFEDGFLCLNYMQEIDDCRNYKFKCIWTEPEHINKLLKEPFHYFKNVGDDEHYISISSHTEDERTISNNIFNMLIDNDDDIIKYDIYTKRYNKNGCWYIKYYLNEGCQSDLKMIIKYNNSSKTFKIEINDNIELLTYNKTMLKNSIDELFDIITDNGY
jgi:hypothetical protein